MRLSRLHGWTGCIAASAMVWAVGCADTGGDGGYSISGKEGRLNAHLIVASDGGSLATLQVNVYAEDDLVASRDLTPVSPGPSMPGEEAPPAGGDAFFVLGAGDYWVKVVPLGEDGSRAMDCTVAESSATVSPGVTTEIFLSLFCGENGALDVVVQVEDRPLITDLTISPSKFVSTCTDVSLAVTADDALGGGLEYSWEVTANPEGAIWALSSDEAGSATFVSQTVGAYEMTVSVTDAGDRTNTLSFPIYINEGDDQSCLDADGDGVLNGEDNCPDVANPDQADDDDNGTGDACEEVVDDADGDGVLDSEDNCPDVANPDQADENGNGTGDACEEVVDDADGDGVLDSEDNCPDVVNPDQADGDDNGTGDACEEIVGDADGDGVLDSEDNCPDAPNQAQADADGDGIGDVCDQDIDGDGILNEDDNCVYKENGDQTDSDGDGTGDACDEEPANA